jgi:transcriptional regulator NrdR family protein
MEGRRTPILRDPERCPSCQGLSRVMDSRRTPTFRWRRRKCLLCGSLWRTYESLINPTAVRLRQTT